MDVPLDLMGHAGKQLMGGGAKDHFIGENGTQGRTLQEVLIAGDSGPAPNA